MRAAVRRDRRRPEVLPSITLSGLSVVRGQRLSREAGVPLPALAAVYSPAMYIVAQRLISKTTRQVGINVFLYLHPNRRWTTPPADIPSVDGGQLRQKTIGLEPNGNVVRSHLDVIAPDDLEIAVLRRHILAFVNRAQSGPMPWKGVDGPCGVALDMVPELVRVGWASEFGALAGAGQQLLENVRYAEMDRSNRSRR
jgi:hypothetical protein